MGLLPETFVGEWELQTSCTEETQRCRGEMRSREHGFELTLCRHPMTTIAVRWTLSTAAHATHAVALVQIVFGLHIQ